MCTDKKAGCVFFCQYINRADINFKMDYFVHEKTIRGFYENIRGDLKYATLLIVCVFISTISRHFVSASIRIKLDGVIGLLINLYVSRWMVFYSLIIVLAHLILYKAVKDQKLVQISFFGTFGYLGFLRIIHWFGLPRLEFITNAIQLIMTLRVKI
jgi:hypothetical protein